MNDKMSDFKVIDLIKYCAKIGKERNIETKFVIYGNINSFDEISEIVEWRFLEGDKVDGVILGYDFGVIKDSNDVILTVASEKYTENDGLRFCEFEHFKNSTVYTMTVEI